MPRRPLTVFDRAVALGRLGEEGFDVLVIGGGITGAGVLLDAASRGLKAALVERDDFAAGTSSKSSKLIHGGLRYLQQREFALVHENLVERQRLLRNAPHLVQPLEFLIPVFGKGGVADKAVVRGMEIALWMYDIAGGWRIGHRHRSISSGEFASHFPTMRQDRLVAGFLYYDAHADDARLTLELVRTAVLDYGATAVNHAAVTRLLRRDGKVRGAVIEPVGGTPIEVEAKALVNATGVWADDVRSLETGERPRDIRPAKGIHLTVSQERLPCDAAAVVPVPGERRSIFVVPWGDHTYLGTTDTDYPGPLDTPVVEREDVEYVLRAINAAVTVPLSPSDVSGSWAGLRPLLASGKGRRRTSEKTSDLSRRHRVMVSRGGLVTVTGGKLTTYRKMAEDAVDALGQVIGPVPPCSTKRLSLRGTTGLDLIERSLAGITDERTIAHLRRRFGGEARAVVALSRERADLAEPLVPGLPYLRAEAVYSARYEMATELTDFLVRRTRALLLDAAATLRAADSVAALVGDELGWDDERRRDELESLSAYAMREGAPGLYERAP